MKQSKNIIIGIIVLLVIAIGAAVAISSSKKSTPASTTTNSSSENSPDSSGSPSSNASNATAATKVDIKNFMFTPMAIKIKVGDTVTWTNRDGVKHNVVADNPSADAPNGPLIAKDETYSFTFKKAGTYTFHCMPHPYMHGTVVVTE